MFTDAHFVKLFETKGMSLNKLKPFFCDKRLTSPFAILNDPCMKFGEYESYPMPLAEVAYYNGF